MYICSIKQLASQTVISNNRVSSIDTSTCLRVIWFHLFHINSTYVCVYNCLSQLHRNSVFPIALTNNDLEDHRATSKIEKKRLLGYILPDLKFSLNEKEVREEEEEEIFFKDQRYLLKNTK